MNLEILSMGEAQKFVPKDRTHLIRIFNEFDHPMYYPLENKDDFVGIKEYYFDDKWPKDWKEYSWVDTNGEDFEKYFQSEKLKHPKITKESIMGYFESIGHPYGRCTLFNPDIAKRIINDIEEVKGNIDTIAVHCRKGKNRSPAVGIFLNEYYNLGHEGLKEKHLEYRQFVYETMKNTFKK